MMRVHPVSSTLSRKHIMMQAVLERHYLRCMCTIRHKLKHVVIIAACRTNTIKSSSAAVGHLKCTFSHVHDMEAVRGAREGLRGEQRLIQWPSP